MASASVHAHNRDAKMKKRTKKHPKRRVGGHVRLSGKLDVEGNMNQGLERNESGVRGKRVNKMMEEGTGGRVRCDEPHIV